MFLTVLLLLEQVKTTSQKIEQILSVSTPTYRIFNAHLLAGFKVLSSTICLVCTKSREPLGILRSDSIRKNFEYFS